MHKMGILERLGKLLPGDYLKTMFYLNCIAKPRKFLRISLNRFNRMDHVYDVLIEFNKTYKGHFSILEFGVGNGYSFTKKLYATKYLKIADRVMVYGFDSFEGLPDTSDFRDVELIPGIGWRPGQFKGNYEKLYDYCRRRYNNFQLHKGYFENTLTDDVLTTLRTYLPILIWIDCDYYTATKSIFEQLIPYIPSGCVIYFDDYELNFGSRFTGEARVVYEINHGLFGDGIELVLNSRRVDRFINLHSKSHYEPISPSRLSIPLWPGNDSRLP